MQSRGGLMIAPKWTDSCCAQLRMIDPSVFYERRAPVRAKEARRGYHALLKRYFRYLIPPGMRVLELACGLGDLLAAVEPARAVGFDFSPSAVAQARQHHPNLQFFLNEASSFPTE